MKLTVLQENLVKALTRISRILSTRPQLPILANALLLANDGGFSVTASSLDITERAEVGAKIEKDGSICVPCRLLTDLVLSLPQGSIALEVKDASLFVSCSGTKATIPGIAAAEFPLPNIKKTGKALVLDKKNMVAALTTVLFAAATDDSRPIFSGVKIETDDDGLLFVATDGYRLSINKLSAKGKDLSGLVVPARALVEVVKIALEEKSEEPIELAESLDKQLVVSVGPIELVARLLDGEYPDYQKIIPKHHATRTLFEKATLLRAVKSAAVFARDNTNIVRLAIDGQRVTVSASKPSVGENTVDVEAKVDGEGGAIAFNSRFLLDLLNKFPQEELLFEMTGSLNPGVFRPVKDESLLHIIMPVRVQS